VLLVRRPDGAEEPFPGHWALPGGFVDVARDNTLIDCSRRKLQEKTGVAAPYLEQLGSDQEGGQRLREGRG
jgi:8-oxo-dGTP diphosphatase